MTLKHKFEFEALGTAWSVETEKPIGIEIKSEITQFIEEFEQVYSRFRSTSFVRRAAETGGSYDIPKGFQELLSSYDVLYKLSEGAINPCVGRSLEALGYDDSYSLSPDTPKPAPNYVKAVRIQGQTVTIEQDILLDVGAIGKGYAVDKVAEIVSSRHDVYVVDGSGDMRVQTHENEIIGLEDPRDTSNVIGKIQMHKGALCASSTNRRAWGSGFHHIIDARTGLPANTDIIATWAVAARAVTADGLATALFFVEPSKLAQYTPDFLYAIMRRDGSVNHNMKQEVFF